MKICICTTPIRPIPTTYPPFGSLAIIQSLRKLGEHVDFYNIDYFRYDRESVTRHFSKSQYDLVGISAVVSTAYAYAKWLASMIRKVSPKTKIVVGGNLAASAEILLRKCGIDFCVVGDGEIIMQNLVSALKLPNSSEELWREIKGICYLEKDGRFNFTGYGPRPSAEEIETPDFGILEKDGSLPHFVNANVNEEFIHLDKVEPGARFTTVIMAKGCVARCTFCHRWEKGYRPRPIEQLIEHIKFLRDRHNVRYINIGDENFGSDREAAMALASELGSLGITWLTAGVRVRTVTKESLTHWKKNGCVAVIYGIESGSQRILDVMEKNASVEENVNALKWTSEAGLATVVQLVIGMPGENDETIDETVEFLKRVSPYLLYWKSRAPSEIISINYAQALPGTPLYEYARQHGLIGQNIDDEERYLIRISDTDAYAEDHFVNHTGLPLLKVLMWRPYILAHLDAHHFLSKHPGASLSLLQVAAYYAKLVLVRLRRQFGATEQQVSIALMTPIGGDSTAREESQRISEPGSYVSDSGYFNIQTNLKFAPMLLNAVTKQLFYPTLALFVALYRTKSLMQGFRLIGEHIGWSLSSKRKTDVAMPSKSLRKVVISVSRRNEDSKDRMQPLRSGR